MKVLIACEYSGTVRDAFTALGHDATSCDLLPTDAPGKHYRGNVLDILYNEYWDLVIAHPPCTRLANSGVRWLTSRKPRTGYIWSDTEQIYINADPQIWHELDAACKFFNAFVEYGKAGHSIGIENPIQHKYARRQIDAPTQIIQPWQFGHGETKATCLWLYNLPQLIPTDIVAGREGKVWKMPPSPDRWKLRSTTYTGIAAAMAQQWNF